MASCNSGVPLMEPKWFFPVMLIAVCPSSSLSPEYGYVMPVALGEAVGRFGARDGGGIFVFGIERPRQFLEALGAQHLVREQRHVPDRHWREEIGRAHV